MNKKILENKIGEKFGFGIFIVFLTMSISLFAFITEENKITGLATYSTEDNVNAMQSNLLEFNDFKSLSTLAAGNYYIDENGIVYWLDDSSKPAVAKTNHIDEIQKSKSIYIDADGNIGFVLIPLEWNQQK